MKRGSGIIMHITSLAGDFGIGTMGHEAYEFVDFLKMGGQKYWQVLPLGPTGYGDSPYQSFSSFAGNPYLISLEILEKQGFLERKDYSHLNFGMNKRKVDFSRISKNKMKVLRIAFENAKKIVSHELDIFRKRNREWLDDYALFMALKTKFNLIPWFEWEHNLKKRDNKTLEKYKILYRNEIEFWIYVQYVFFTQWNNLKEYANSKGIKIIGDIPFYTAYDSADTWANSELFYFDRKYKPLKVAGCPPDSFSRTGQLWGNPIYNWRLIEKKNFDWWIKRIEANSKLYDVIRMDHFRGFESYWEVPFGEETAVNGKWVKGPGMKLFHAVDKSLGKLDIIAEDLGFLTPEVKELLRESSFHGMKVLQFAFNPRERNDYLPHKYNRNCVAYTGTHDNDTIKGWLKTSKNRDVSYAMKYLGLNHKEGYSWGVIRGVWSSVADIAMAQMQDFVGLGSNARMNTPSTFGGDNWKWRITKDKISDELSEKIYEITDLYGRL